MQFDEISPHLIRIFDFVSKGDRWFTSDEIASGAAVARRTANAHARTLAQLGVFERTEVFTGYRYRLAEQAPCRFLERIGAARKAFNMEATR